MFHRRGGVFGSGWRFLGAQYTRTRSETEIEAQLVYHERQRREPTSNPAQPNVALQAPAGGMSRVVDIERPGHSMLTAIFRNFRLRITA